MAESEEATSALNSIVFGSVAGMTAKVFEHPFDLVKVRLQSQRTDRPLVFRGPFDCFRQTYRSEGIKGLYRGISMPILGAAAENATLFLVYNKCQDLIIRLNPHTPTERSTSPIAGSMLADEEHMSEKKKGKRRELSNGELALAAAGAGAAASFVLTPIELIKCRMQVQMMAREGVVLAAVPSTGNSSPIISSSSAGSSSSARSLHTSSLLRQIPRSLPSLPPLEGPIALTLGTIRASGFRGLWLGQTGTLLRETGGSAAWFTTYEVLAKFFISRRQVILDTTPGSEGQRRTLTKGDLAMYELMLSGASAGVMYNVTLFPADSVKSAVQTWAELNPDKPKLGFAAMAQRIWRTRGLKGLYAGCGLTVMRSAPSSAMIFLIYETLVQKYGDLLG